MLAFRIGRNEPLNEVRTGPGSILAGPVEVSGQSASLIFANPSGITVNGAAFINGAHVIFTTSAPLWLGAGQPHQ
jgi:filamentous hemagglutinin family protein